MDYEQTIELEQNIKIKNEANKVYNDFLTYAVLNVSNYKFGQNKFKVWSDAHNSEYLRLEENSFVFECRFLHEKYDVRVTPSDLFSHIKNKYRGYDHFHTFVELAKQKHMKE